jgi:F-type H+-transporting ATPase subunit b
MNALFVLAQEHGGHGAGGNPAVNPMDVAEHANHAAAFWSFGIVVTLFVVLGFLVWKPIAKGLTAREDRINESLKRAEELERATRELQETNRKAMEKAQQEAQQVVAEARVAAQKAAADVTAKAEAEIEASRERFQRELRLEADKVRAEIRREAVEITLAAASRLIGRHLSGADHTRLVEESLRDAESVVRN